LLAATAVVCGAVGLLASVPLTMPVPAPLPPPSDPLLMPLVRLTVRLTKVGVPPPEVPPPPPPPLPPFPVLEGAAGVLSLGGLACDGPDPPLLDVEPASAPVELFELLQLAAGRAVRCTCCVGALLRGALRRTTLRAAVRPDERLLGAGEGFEATRTGFAGACCVLCALGVARADSRCVEIVP
jgi:hypothetical protein